MIEFSMLTLLLMIVVPIIVVIVIALKNSAFHPWISLIGISVVIVGLILLGFGGEVDLDTSLIFMGEPITFSISMTAILLCITSLLGLGILVWSQTRQQDPAMTHYQWAMLNLSLSFGLVAFFSGQFMVRYIALDIVGLLAALTVLSSFSATSGVRQFIIIFQILRLGDLSLLASILIINHVADTLDISKMIASAVDMSPEARMWVFFGFLLALLIKMAIWPFGIWLQRARQSAPKVSFWVSGVLVPALGYYLLYRIMPIINSAVIFQNLTLYTALALAVLIFVLALLRVIKVDRFTQISGLMGCFLLAGSAVGGSQFILYYLLGLILHRWLLYVDRKRLSPFLSVLITLYPLLINSLYLAGNLDNFSTMFMIGWGILTVSLILWDFWTQHTSLSMDVLVVPQPNNLLRDEVYGGILVIAARWLNRTLEFGVLTHGIARFSKAFHRLADWLYQNVELRIEKLWIWMGRKLLEISEETLQFEQRFEKLLVWMGEKLMLISEGTLQKVELEAAQTTRGLMDDTLKALDVYEQNVLKKALRWDLAWIPFLLVVILIMLFVL